MPSRSHNTCKPINAKEISMHEDAYNYSIEQGGPLDAKASFLMQHLQRNAAQHNTQTCDS
jgi:hypothetical protein